MLPVYYNCTTLHHTESAHNIPLGLSYRILVFYTDTVLHCFDNQQPDNESTVVCSCPSERAARSVKPNVVGHGGSRFHQGGDGSAATGLDDRRHHLHPSYAPPGLFCARPRSHPHHGSTPSVRVTPLDAAESGLRASGGLHSGEQ